LSDVRWNIWDCQKCEQPTLCIELADGVTPFMLRCRATPGCDGWAHSRFYPGGPRPDLPVRGEWYAPDAAETNKLDRAMRHHVDQGGLMLREKLVGAMNG